MLLNISEKLFELFGICSYRGIIEGPNLIIDIMDIQSLKTLFSHLSLIYHVI